MIKALLFDFDGLILDTETPDVETWKAIYSEYGLDYPKEHWSQNIGGWGISTFDPAEELHRLIPEAPDVAALRRRQRQDSDAVILRAPIMNGVHEYLAAAKGLGLRLAIASSSERAWVEPHLARLGLISFFDRIICGDDVAPGRTKPHPDVFLKALEALQVTANEALVFEDSPHGVAAARAAGIVVVAVPNPITAALPMVDASFTLKSLADLRLEELLRRVAATADSGRPRATQPPMHSVE